VTVAAAPLGVAETAPFVIGTIRPVTSGASAGDLRPGCEPAGTGPVADRELAARLVSGEHEALAEVYDAYGGLVYGLSRRVVRDEALAKDVTQEVFLFVWEHPERYDPAQASLRSWLGMLAHRRSVDRVRAETRRVQREARREALAEPAAADDETDSLHARWVAEQVRTALDTLPAEQRDVIHLAYFGGRTYRQVASDLGIPEGTAKSRMRLALSRLQAILGPILGTGEGQAHMGVSARSEKGAPAWT
jgi:RNA polymerase sigma-70 factor (ECF subfamily)